MPRPKGSKNRGKKVPVVRNIGIAVGLPFSGRLVTPEWAVSLGTQVYPLNTNIVYIMIKGKPIDEARNEIVEEALKVKSKYVFFIDDDVCVPADGIRKLVYALQNHEEKTMVAGGIYCAKYEPTEPIVYNGDGHGAFWRWKVGEVFECSGIGTGCMLINTEIFNHIKRPFFKTVDLRTGEKVQITDDLYFCKKVKDAGFKMIGVGDVLCLHVDNNTGKFYTLPENSYPLIQ